MRRGIETLRALLRTAPCTSACAEPSGRILADAFALLGGGAMEASGIDDAAQYVPCGQALAPVGRDGRRRVDAGRIRARSRRPRSAPLLP